MIQVQQCTWRISPEISPEDIVSSLTESFRCLTEPTVSLKRVYYDSFDWRLYRKKRLLFIENGKWQLCRRSDGQVKISLNFDKKPLRFWWEFSESVLSHQLHKILDMRALLPLASLTLEINTFRILNRDSKTVAFVELRSRQNIQAGGAVLHDIHLRSVRGYSGKYKKLTRLLRDFQTKEPVADQDELADCLRGTNRTPLDYSSKFSVRLDPDSSGYQAARVIYKNLLATMQRNEQGIIDDLDSEFLHDFRVAIRRTRSALALIKNVMDPEVVEHFAEKFRFLGQVTGPTRDLDVYLLMEDSYRARLPDRLQEGLGYFFQDLGTRRTLEQKKLVRALRGIPYREIIESWQEYLNHQDQETSGKNAERPIRELACKIILKRYKRVLHDGGRIQPATPDEQLHRLRIQGKKLRYVLEFFRSLYPKGEMKTLISQLKNLQNNLGDFNDLSVQREMLRGYLAEIKPGTKRSKEMAAAIGGLLTNMYHEQHLVRTRFEETFSHFAAKKNTKLYQQLFTCK